MSQFFTDYHEARHAAGVKAKALGLPVALRKTTEYGKHGFVVRLMEPYGEDSAWAERVLPTDPRWPRGCDCAQGDGCRR